MTTQELIQQEADKRHPIPSRWDNMPFLNAQTVRNETFIEGAAFGASLRDAEVKELQEQLSVYANATVNAMDTIDEMQSLNVWVSVKDRLPTEEDADDEWDDVWWYYLDGSASSGSWDNKYIIENQATHWRRIVKP